MSQFQSVPPQNFAPNAGNPVPNPYVNSIDLPLYGAGFGKAVSRFFKKYATFSGRASRSEYWWIQFMNFAIGTVMGIVFVAGILPLYDNAGVEYQSVAEVLKNNDLPGLALFAAVFMAIYSVIIIVPSWAVTWRRLHDSDHSGGFFFIQFVPLVGQLVLFVLLILGPNPRGARFDS